MLDNFREWLSDNLRYILLGLAGILVLVIAFFAIRLVTSLGSPKEKETEAEISTENMTEAPVQKTEVQMVKEASDSELQKLMTQYYTAMAAKDYDTLAAIDETFSEEAKAEIEADVATEAYNNIMTYSKPGLTEGSYVVYVYLEIKITGITTPAPSLHERYVVTNADGKLVVGNDESSQELKDYLLSMQTDSEVRALIADVDQKLADAKAQDADLAAYVESLYSDSADGDQSGAEGEGDTTAATGMMQATTGVNVRAEASVDSTQNGSLYAGMQVEVLENLDNGWSHVRYTANGTTIEGYVMTQYLGPIG